MTWQGWLQALAFLGLLGATVLPVGRHMAKTFAGEKTFLHPILGPIERAIYRAAGVDPAKEQGWVAYLTSLLSFHALAIIALFVMLALQGALPLNPTAAKAMSFDLAFNTAVSFVTNTSWQSYAGESALSHFSQMAGISVASFLSAAAGIAVAIAFIRGLARSNAETIGNYWVDQTRAVLYVLLPLSMVGALALLVLGVPQTITGVQHAATLEGATQAIAVGPVASQEAIKLLSGDGGGFFNANSAHPFENPTPLSNLVELILMGVIGAGLTNTFGRMIGDQRQGFALLGAMSLLLLCGGAAIYLGEAQPNPHLHALGALGANMEGKEVRFGAAGSSLFAEMSTATADGAVNAMHDSFAPLSGAVLMANMKIGEVIIGAPGSGLFSILLFALLAVFISGLMIGRTPEYLGKKVETREIQFTMLAFLAAPLATLGFTALAVVIPAGLAARQATGPHGLSEILYAYTSAAATNGSAFAGLSANTPFYNTTLAAAMLIGRFLIIVPVLAIAGSLASKPRAPPSLGVMPTDSGQFVGLLVGVILIVGGLCYFPVLTLGPILERLTQ
jgi:K+-transporting ATPase ATPase A chain